MGSSKKATVGYRYFLGLHFGLCHGPVDSLQEVRAGDRRAWIGDATTNTSLQIESPELFGGEKKEGGLSGALDVMMGGPTQGQNDYLVSKIGALVPAFRGILSAVWRGGLVSANNPYIKPWAFKVKRISAGWSGGAAWNAAKAEIVINTQQSLAPWNAGTFDPRNFENEHEYRVAADKPWRKTLAEAIADINFSAGFLKPAALAEIVGWSLNGQNAFPAFDVSPGDADSIFLHFNRLRPDNYYGVMQSVGGFAYCSPFQFEGIEISSEFFWWSGLTETSGVITTSAPGLHRLVRYTDILEDEVFLNNCINYPSQTDGYFPVAAVTRDIVVEVRRIIRPIGAMNPAHIIYECLTNDSWGMGYPDSAIDEARFSQAADTLFSEGLGLCMIWNKQETIEAFIKLVLEHAGGILYVDPASGKFALKLIRDDYDTDTLPVFGPSNLVSASDYQRKAWGETVNELTVVFRNVTTNKDSSVTVQDLANIQTQGAVVSQTRQYPGIPSADLAQRLAMRDLNTLSTPLARVRLVANRSAWSLIPGDVFRLNWPEFGVEDVVFRVLEVNRGTLQDGTITIDASEDVFGLPSNTYVSDQPNGWVEPTTGPQPAPFRKLVEAPYWDFATTLTAADLDYIDELSGYIETLAARPSGDSLNYEINSKTGAAPYAERATADFCPTATLSAPIGKLSTSITFVGAIDVDLVDPGGYAIIGDEYVGITAIDADAGTATITRGVLDTVPAEHPNGARIWFADGFQGSDPTEYASGESVDVKMLPRTGQGELSASGAPSNSITVAARHNKPYPPGLFRISGQAYPASLADVALSASWAHRDRLTQTAYLVQQSEGNIGPEAGTSYTLQLWNHATGTLLQSYTGLTGTSQAFTALPSGAYTLRVELWSVRGGVASHQKHSHAFDYININLLNTEGLNRITTEAGDVIELE